MNTCVAFVFLIPDTSFSFRRSLGSFPSLQRSSVNAAQSATASSIQCGVTTCSMDVTLVYVDCVPSDIDKFIDASGANARSSVLEPDNARFDCLQDLSDPTKFVLVEIYGSESGPVAHKETAHYLTWRKTVADSMATPRSATKYLPCFPAGPEGWSTPEDMASKSTDSEKKELAGIQITHVFVSCKPGTEEAFLAETLTNAKSSVQEPDNLRFDVLQEVGDPTKFLLVEVYKTAQGPVDHKETAHYNAWREAVADMMAEPRQARKYASIFPVTLHGWQT